VKVTNVDNNLWKESVPASRRGGRKTRRTDTVFSFCSLSQQRPKNNAKIIRNKNNEK
jgi:hypothetical protein